MGMSVRTAHGRQFRRAGIEFGPEPVVVGKKDLAEVVDPGFKGKRKPRTRGEVLEAEPMLVCVECAEPDASGEKGEKK